MQHRYLALNNPVTDIIDSYYIAKVGYENTKGEK